MSSRSKRRASSMGRFTPLVHEYFMTPQFAALSPRAVKLLIEVYMQFNGANNGDLCASWSVIRKRGWTSKDQLAKALAELDATRWLERTRQGSIHKATLYAVSFRGIDHCGGKLDVKADPKPSHGWRYPETSKMPSRRRVRKTHPVVRPAGNRPPHEVAISSVLPATLPRPEGRSAANAPEFTPCDAGTLLDICQG